MSDAKPVSSSFTARRLDLARGTPDPVCWIGAVAGIFLLTDFLPAGTARFDNAAY